MQVLIKPIINIRIRTKFKPRNKFQ